EGVSPGDRVAIIGATSTAYLVVMLGALRVGAVPAPMAPSSAVDTLRSMIDDASPTHVFMDDDVAATLGDLSPIARSLADEAFAAWLSPAGATPLSIPSTPDADFNVIYSSGTTGTPKGIVQSHAMRWQHVRRGRVTG